MKKIFNTIIAFLTLLAQAKPQNYDETKVSHYTLPELLKKADGQRVNTSAQWEEKRRIEVLTLFENNVYGRMPKKYDSIRFSTIRTTANAMGGKALLKETSILVWNHSRSVEIKLVMFIPNKTEKPAPGFLLINNRSRRNTEPSRDTLSEFWPAEMLVDSGYAIAAFHVSDAAPDNKQTFTQGALQLYPEQLSAGNGMKAIGAWAWAASRVMDYFEQDKTVDARKVFLVGHSRGGKAALWAGAQDQRFAAIFSNCSGNTGAALSRRKFGETVKRINEQFPHWFADNYKKYNDNEAALPVDQHMLIALIAPRPLYTTNASKDLWADPKGSFLSLKHAEDVYALYRKHSALPSEPPAINKPIINSYLGYHNREGEHNLTAYDWTNFVRFANYHFKTNQTR